MEALLETSGNCNEFDREKIHISGTSYTDDVEIENKSITEVDGLQMSKKLKGHENDSHFTNKVNLTEKPDEDSEESSHEDDWEDSDNEESEEDNLLENIEEEFEYEESSDSVETAEEEEVYEEEDTNEEEYDDEENFEEEEEEDYSYFEEESDFSEGFDSEENSDSEGSYNPLDSEERCRTNLQSIMESSGSVDVETRTSNSDTSESVCVESDGNLFPNHTLFEV